MMMYQNASSFLSLYALLLLNTSGSEMRSLRYVLLSNICRQLTEHAVDA